LPRDEAAFALEADDHTALSPRDAKQRAEAQDSALVTT
jgi:hypothetical protein